MDLRGKQKRYLRSQAHEMRPLFQIGKEGINENWLKQIEAALNKHELIKINILQNATVSEDEVIAYIEANSQIQVVQKIGRVLVLFKQASKRENRKISQIVAKI